MAQLRILAAAAAIILASISGAFAAGNTDNLVVAALPESETIGLPEGLQVGRNTVVAYVDLSEQTMRLYVGGRLEHVWPVSTGTNGHITPTGQWNAYWLSPNHRSSLYGNAPMPWSVFFNGNYAVHGTNSVELLGRPASHGCIRLDTANAEIFFRLVQEHGLNRSLVAVVA